ncbi:MAG: SDR family NAD(P)-dependent oxidoreductase, partial [Deltaproteobacteria bacterium]|nr:SDR family NAD(P)-dependent oxidoreductase [Deltaproteobacteria bacterium]
MGENLKGKNAIVTGAGRGVFREIAFAVAAEGARVLVVDPGVTRGGDGPDIAPAEEVVQEIKNKGGEATACFESVAEFDTAEKIIKTCVDTYGRLDILINGAGILRERMIFNMSEDDWDAVLTVHLKGTFNMCRHASALMRAQKYGRIVNCTSDAYRWGSVGQSNYSAEKGGIVSFTRSIARELGRYDITCNVIAPLAATRMTLDQGVISGMKKRFQKGLISEEQYEEMINMPGPEFVAPMVVYLATDEAANINGQVFGAGGGRIARYSWPEDIAGIYKDHEKDGPWQLEDII